jgi:hypothetical protein
MKTHNASIHHCLFCGRVAHSELEAEPPQCCGHTMVKAGEETIRECDAEGKKAGGHTDALRPMIKNRTNPRCPPVADASPELLAESCQNLRSIPCG